MQFFGVLTKPEVHKLFYSKDQLLVSPFCGLTFISIQPDWDSPQLQCDPGDLNAHLGLKNEQGT